MMHAFSKALGANGKRKTRFHTERGQLLPLAAWPGVFRSGLQRLTHRRAEVPWMAPSAVGYLDRVIQPAWTVFEFGSGASTAWYAKRARSIISVEHNPEWFRQVSLRMVDENVKNCRLEFLESPEEFTSAIERFEDDAFDLVIVDGSEAWPGHRLDCLAAAKSKVKPGGLIVLDDSDRATYRAADDVLAAWLVKRFVDVKPMPLAAVETSIFARPLNPANGRANGTARARSSSSGRGAVEHESDVAAVAARAFADARVRYSRAVHRTDPSTTLAPGVSLF